MVKNTLLNDAVIFVKCPNKKCNATVAVRLTQTHVFCERCKIASPVDMTVTSETLSQVRDFEQQINLNNN